MMRTSSQSCRLETPDHSPYEPPHGVLRLPMRSSTARRCFLRIADRLASFDGELAGEAFLEALTAALSARRNGSRGGLVLVADVAHVARPANTPPRAVDLLLEGR